MNRIDNKMAEANKFVFWAPRILIIVFALFLAIFSLDIFDGNYGFWGTILGLFVHNIPSLILLVILLMSWKNGLVGGITFMILGFACVIGTIAALLMLNNDAIHRPLIIGHIVNPILIIGSIVFLFIGVLFLVGWKKNRQK